MKQWLGVGDPERGHKNEESRTSTRNEGPGTTINIRNEGPGITINIRNEGPGIRGSKIRGQESSLKDQESNLNPNNQESRTKNYEPRPSNERRLKGPGFKI